MAYRVNVSSTFGNETILVASDQVMGAVIEALELLDYQTLDSVTGITIDPQ